ncbi:MAG: peptidylprolyl isomerase [Halioglobus sp.]
MKFYRNLIVLIVAFSISSIASGQNVLEDKDVGITQEELEYIVKYWTPDMREAAANNLGDRLELLNRALTSKKIAAAAREITRESDPDTYWKHQFALRNLDRQLVVDQFLADLVIPDMSDLAPERYHAQKKQYAFVPESRYSSHILLMCPAGQCIRANRRPEAEKILADLRAGAKFEDMVLAHSEDPGSKDEKGAFKKALILGMKDVDPHYVGGVFEIEKVGDYSGIVESRFGFHIIRLDLIQDSYYRPYEEVKSVIIADLETEFKKLSAKDFDNRFRITDEAFVDGEAMEKIFEPYKTADPRN